MRPVLIASLLLLSIAPTYCLAPSARALESNEVATVTRAVDDPAQALHYQVAWNRLAAAHATVKVIPDTIAGQKAYTIEAIARSNRFIDLFYRFRGQSRVIFLAREQKPLHFRFDRQIRGVPSVTTIEFRPSEEMASSLYLKNGVKKKELRVAGEDLFDPITAVFRARHDDLKIGARKSYDIFTGESRYRIDLTVEGSEAVEVPAGAFSALRITPQVWKVHGDDRPPDARLRNATIWVTNDSERILLKIRSEIFIGAVTLDLLAREITP